MRMTRNGVCVSDGFYGGPHKKYRDMIVITPEAKWARTFETEVEANCVADFFNKRGYEFVVRDQEVRQAQIDKTLLRLPWQKKMIETLLHDSLA